MSLSTTSFQLAMGVELSMQVAEQVISACQRVDDEDRIDKILLNDEAVSLCLMEKV